MLNHTVALLIDFPDNKLYRGDVGTVVVDLSDSKVEVEFVDKHGRTSALVVLDKEDLIVLRLEAALA